MEPSDDGAIIVASRTTPVRFAEIFDRHAGAIRSYLARRVGIQLADDLTAETFVEAFRIRDRYDENRPDARPWLFGIASNKLRRHLRSERRQLRAFARWGADPVDAGVIERAAEQVDAQRVVAEALAALTTDERDALLLFTWADLSYDEIAMAMGVPVGTVRSRLSRARGRVREVAETLGWPDDDDSFAKETMHGG